MLSCCETGLKQRMLATTTARTPLRRRVPRNSQSRAAVNERLYRERRRRGAIVVQQLVLSPAAISVLISLGRLSEADRGDRERVTDAFVGFAKRALAPTRAS